MKKNNRKRGSFFALLLKNYIVFTVVNVILVLLIFSLGTMALTAHLKMPAGDVTSQLGMLESGQYERIKPYKLVGAGGYFEILNHKNDVIFLSDPEIKVENYTAGEVECIQDYISDIVVDVQSYTDKNGKKITELSGNTYFDQSTTREYFIVIDENGKVMLASPNIKKTEYTKREFAFLTDDVEDGLSISKYKFKGNDGNKYTMIIKTAFSDMEVVDAYYRGLTFIGIGIIICYILSILVFVFWLSQRVNKPLNSLNKAMVAFAEGDREQEVAYSGAAEFVQICDSFNNMAELLKNSESAKLEIQRQKQKMLADISHDLKTPITTIQGYAKALSDGMIAQQDQKKYLDKIYNKSMILTDLINTFYEYSKLEHPDFNFVFETLEINEFFREYVAGRYEEITDKNFELELDIPEEIAFCKVDKVQLTRAFDNVLNNALKHNPQGTRIFLKTIVENTDNARQRIKIIIADNGVGISGDMTKTIFEAFMVGDESRSSKQGSGLGLSISKKIIEGHGGSITLESLPNSQYKTVFEILLPKINI